MIWVACQDWLLSHWWRPHAWTSTDASSSTSISKWLISGRNEPLLEWLQRVASKYIQLGLRTALFSLWPCSSSRFWTQIQRHPSWIPAVSSPQRLFLKISSSLPQPTPYSSTLPPCVCRLDSSPSHNQKQFHSIRVYYWDRLPIKRLGFPFWFWFCRGWLLLVGYFRSARDPWWCWVMLL